MSLWIWVLVAGALSFAVKMLGYLLPDSLFDNPRIASTANYITIGMLAALLVTNTVASGQGLGLDARLVALGAAALALALRAPFIVVIIAGAAAAGFARLLVW